MIDIDKWDDLKDFSQPYPRTSDPYITITKEQLISLSAGFMRQAKYQIANNTHVVLAYSELNNAIIFNFTSDLVKFPGALKLSIKNQEVKFSNSADCRQGRIAAKSFLRHYNIDPNISVGRYKSKVEIIPKRGECWVVYLDERIHTKPFRVFYSLEDPPESLKKPIILAIKKGIFA